MLNRHARNRRSQLLAAFERLHCNSILNGMAIGAFALFTSSLSSSVEARVAALQVELPSVQGWQIHAVSRGGGVMCSARPKEESDVAITLLADTGKYRGGEWFLGIVSRNQHLEPSIEETEASLVIDGKQVATGTAVATIGRFVRFDFPAIDSHVEKIRAAHVIEVQAQGLIPLQLESLSIIINTIEECQTESRNPEFWNRAEHVCN